MTTIHEIFNFVQNQQTVTQLKKTIFEPSIACFQPLSLPDFRFHGIVFIPLTANCRKIVSTDPSSLKISTKPNMKS